MRKLRLFQSAIALGIATASTSALAADHLDGPGGKSPGMNAAADITDVYAWTTAKTAVFVMNVFPLADKTMSKFDNTLLYAVHTESSAGYGMAGTKLAIIAQFDASQKIQLWVGDKDYVAGDASPSGGLKSSSGLVNVFSGVRADPFFFNLAGFKDAVATVDGAEGALKFDGSGCPTLDAATATALVGMLQGTAMGKMPAANFFATANVLSIVVEVDKSLVMGGGPVLAVWGSTNKAG